MTIAAVTVLLGLAGNLAAGTVRIPDGGRPWIWAVTVLLAVLAIANEVRRDRVAGQAGAPIDLHGAVDQLAEAMGRQWRREEDQRKINDPVPLPLRWHPAPEKSFDHWANVHRAPPGTDPGPVDLTGQLPEIAAVFQRIPSRRLVILGQPGAGKTILAARLALDLIAARRSGDPVPAIVSVASWNPGTDLRTWLAAQLIRDHPGLAVPYGNDRDLAAALVDAGLILPILDGFDEIPEGAHLAAVHQLNTTPDLPMVITSRSDQYIAAVAGTDVLTAAAGIELDDVPLTDLASYLPRTTRRQARDREHAGVWDPVLDDLNDRPRRSAAAAVREALSTPLMVYLARTVYSDAPDHDPAELLRWPTAAAVEQRLMAMYIPAVYQRSGSTGYPSPDQARRWLTYLARHLDALGTRDLAWWQLERTIPRFLFSLVTALLGALAVGLVVAPLAGVGAGVTLWLSGGLVASVAVWIAHTRASVRARGRQRLLASYLATGFVLGIAAGLAVRLGGGPTAGLAGGVTGGLLTGAVAGLIGGYGNWRPKPIRTLDSLSPRSSLRIAGVSAAKRAVTGVAGGTLGAAVSVGSLVGIDGSGLWLAMGLGLASGLLVGLDTAWGRFVLARVWPSLCGHLPWRLMWVLDDAHRRGVLRQAGAVYQFRHARLQDHLTSLGP